MTGTQADEPDAQKTPEQIRDEIKETRAQLGDTVEALGAKTDVKGQAQAKVDDLKDQAQTKVSDFKDKVGGGSSTTATGAGPQDHAQAAAAKVRQNPLPAAILLALVFGYLIGRRTGK